MELLGTKNTENSSGINELIQQLLSSNNISAICTDLIATLNGIINQDKKELYRSDIVSLLFILDHNPEVSSIPIINNLATELRLKLIRLQCMNTSSEKATKSVCTAEAETCEGELPESAKAVAPSVRGVIDNGIERFIPRNDDFQLPDPGTNGNLTLSGIDYEIGKWVEREVIIDHEGYLVRQIKYGVANDDEANEIYSDDFLEALKNSENDSAAEKIDTIKEAEKTCMTNGESAAETGTNENQK